MNTKFKVIGFTQLGIKPESTAREADALTIRPSELLICRVYQIDLMSLFAPCSHPPFSSKMRNLGKMRNFGQNFAVFLEACRLDSGMVIFRPN